jgi:hypothetical protein
MAASIREESMKKITMLLCSAAACAGIQGCALQADTDGAPRAERVYITGSNIARKEHSGEVSVMSAEAFERARSSITPPIPRMPGGTH